MSSFFPSDSDSSHKTYRGFSSGTNFPGSTDTRKFQELHAVLEMLNIGIWTQRSNVLCLSAGWCRLFGVPEDDIFLLEDYLMLIDDPDERRRVGEFRDNFHQNPPQTLWTDTFSLAGKSVHSRAIVTEDETLFGVDILE